MEITPTEQLLEDPTISAIVDRCGWIDRHWQFDKGVERCRTTTERFAASLLDCADKRNPAGAAIRGLTRHGYQPTDKSLQYVNGLLNPQTTNPEVMEKVRALFPDPFARPAKTAGELLAEKMLKAHGPELERQGIFSAVQFIASDLWKGMKGNANG